MVIVSIQMRFASNSSCVVLELPVVLPHSAVGHQGYVKRIRRCAGQLQAACA
jgi:hypothetical protein